MADYELIANQFANLIDSRPTEVIIPGEILAKAAELVAMLLTD